MIKAEGEMTASGLVHQGRTELHGIIVNTDGVNDVSVVVYDNTAPSGKVVWRQTVKGDDHTGGAFFAAKGIALDVGLYLKLTSVGVGRANAYYRL